MGHDAWGMAHGAYRIGLSMLLARWYAGIENSAESGLKFATFIWKVAK
jgi:hypothetical protein